MKDQLDHLYTPLEEAVSLLHERRAEPWNTQTSQRFTTPRHVAPYQSCDMSQHSKFKECLMLRPTAVLFRHVASPNFELSRFISLATAAGLTPWVLEFQRDKFTDYNHAKYALARLSFHGGTGRNGGSRIRCLSVADMERSNGLPLDQVVTHQRQPLIAFHHELLATCPQLSAIEHYDASDLFRAHGPTARQYYADFFGLFVERAILFESFLLTSNEKPFTTEIVLPAFESACARHGKRPLICRLDAPEAEGDPYWLQYPMELLPVAQQLLECKPAKAAE